jgi:hypothetical protein
MQLPDFTCLGACSFRQLLLPFLFIIVATFIPTLLALSILLKRCESLQVRAAWP